MIFQESLNYKKEKPFTENLILRLKTQQQINVKKTPKLLQQKIIVDKDQELTAYNQLFIKSLVNNT